MKLKCKREKIGLALEGGGARGSYQVGAYYAFLDCKVRFDCICGTSIGAFNGAMLASHKEKELLQFWETVDVGKILGLDTDYLKKKYKGEKTLGFLFSTIKQFYGILKKRGIPIDGLKNVLDEIFNEEELRKSNIDFGMCTVRLHSLKPCYFFKKDMKNGLIDDYILASCYLPVFRLTKRIDDHFYVDGGFYDNSPVNMLLERGYNKIYVVGLNALINIHRRPLREADITCIHPSRRLGGPLNMNQNRIKDNIKMGYYDTYKVLKNLDGYDYVFKRKNKRYYSYISRFIHRKEMKRIMNFFKTDDVKCAIILSIEYVLREQKVNYYQIYHPYHMIKVIRKKYKKQHFVYNFVRKLRNL